jgi:hypothetical protein
MSHPGTKICGKNAFFSVLPTPPVKADYPRRESVYDKLWSILDRMKVGDERKIKCERGVSPDVMLNRIGTALSTAQKSKRFTLPKGTRLRRFVTVDKQIGLALEKTGRKR